MKEKFPICYVDMDGVLADLYGHATKAHKVDSYREIQTPQWEKFFKESNAEDLFSNLEPFPSNQALLDIVTKKFDGYNILSSPLNFDKEGSIKGKTRWLKNNIAIKPNKEWIFDHEKFKYAKQEDGTPNILIDDYTVNIDKWNAAGGIGLKWQADEQSLADLKKMLDDALKDFK